MIREMAAAAGMLALLGGPIAAQQNTSKRNPVADAGSATFEVVNKWGSGDQSIWCAAAQAALSRGAAWKDRLYVVDVKSAAQSPYGAETITFTFRPTQEQLAQATSGSSSTRGIGNNISVNSANRRCQRDMGAT
ncbi:hypothetical protein [Shimia haliotis]|uniref:Uncharacterized protein n=1 Tax=Shimia haliotis TaxID=1280847 RepID=A0A1I4A9K1_9RHOB|nr:hypothetical protein [Shimia haliotis]SFK53092.1 hypothetical protein SAMN04488036_101240 [Shimia haliotis]